MPFFFCLSERYTAYMDPLTEVTSSRLRDMINLCHLKVPGFEIRFKNLSPWMKFLNFFAQFFNKDFMTHYTTTTGSVVYVPSKAKLLEDQEGFAAVLAHELVHMTERQQTGLIPYFLQYAFPQILAALALLIFGAFWSPWFLLALLFLLALVPWPAYWRKEIELRGYTMSMAVQFWTTNDIRDDLLLWYAKQFTGSAYYFMWPWHENIMLLLKRRSYRIRSGVILKDPLFRQVYDIMKPR